MNDDFGKSWVDIPKGMKSMGQGIANVLNGLLKWLVSPVNAIIGGLNKIPLVNIPTVNASVPPPTFAQGGFPNQGQMFIAREAGPELVGTIGGRTAVANNNQIVESVSAGVYSAVREAMSGFTGKGNGETNFNLYLDSRQITSAVEKVQKERGLSLINGNVVYG